MNFQKTNIIYNIFDICTKTPVIGLPAGSILKQVQMIEVLKGNKAPQGSKLFEAKDKYMFNAQILN
jgi:hypothetical protein